MISTKYIQKIKYNYKRRIVHRTNRSKKNVNKNSIISISKTEFNKKEITIKETDIFLADNNINNMKWDIKMMIYNLIIILINIAYLILPSILKITRLLIQYQTNKQLIIRQVINSNHQTIQMIKTNNYMPICYNNNA